jgi:hypothetical protein
MRRTRYLDRSLFSFLVNDLYLPPYCRANCRNRSFPLCLLFKPPLLLSSSMAKKVIVCERKWPSQAGQAKQQTNEKQDFFAYRPIKTSFSCGSIESSMFVSQQDWYG